jgi:hypothetical protein
MKTLFTLLFLSTIVFAKAQNPIITEMFTADPAAIVYNDTVFLYAGHDEATVNGNGYVMNNWQVFSSSDMVNWASRGEVFNVDIINPTGPFEDALGKALITNNQTTGIDSYWDDIDPTVFIDDDNQAYLYWGNSACYFVKLKENMIETEGDIQVVNLPSFTEAPYIHKYKNTYYLSYAYGWPEKIAYATSTSITGPWTFAKVINDNVNQCGTNHQSIIEFQNQWYFIYHTGDIGGDFRRSVAIEYLYYNNDGSIREIVQTPFGVEAINKIEQCKPSPID